MSEEILRHSLPKEQAKLLTTIHKTRPQMEGISSRNLLKVLPWINVQGGFYRVNRRQVLEIRPGHVTFIDNEGVPEIYGPSLNQMPSFRAIKDEDLLNLIAAEARVVNVEATNAIINVDEAHTSLYIVVKGKISFHEPKEFYQDKVVGSMGPGQYFGEYGLFTNGAPLFEYNAIADTPVQLLVLDYDKIKAVLDASANHKDHIVDHKEDIEELKNKVNRKGESIIDLYSGLHEDEPDIPSTYVAYDLHPKEYELHTGQTILKIHTKVADLYNNPHNQTEEQVRLTIEELREAQEHEMINNKDFGLLHAADYRQKLQTRKGPPTPNDLDELISKRRKTNYIFAHPKAIAAFTRECNHRGIYPDTVEIDGREVIAWRGIPILTCNKIPVVNGVTSMIAMRVGEEDQGVVGLYQMGIPEEVEPSMSVRYMGIDKKAIISYLITNYFSVAILVPDAVGILEHVEVDVHLK